MNEFLYAIRFYMRMKFIRQLVIWLNSFESINSSNLSFYETCKNRVEIVNLHIYNDINVFKMRVFEWRVCIKFVIQIFHQEARISISCSFNFKHRIYSDNWINILNLSDIDLLLQWFFLIRNNFFKNVMFSLLCFKTKTFDQIFLRNSLKNVFWTKTYEKNIRISYHHFKLQMNFNLSIQLLLSNIFDSNEKILRFHFLLTKESFSKRIAKLILLSNKNSICVAFFTHVKSNSMLSIFDSLQKTLKTSNSMHTWRRKSLILHLKCWKNESHEKTKLKF